MEEVIAAIDRGTVQQTGLLRRIHRDAGVRELDSLDITTFSNLITENPREWMEGVRRYFDRKGIDQNPVKMDIVIALLKQEPRFWFGTLTVAQRADFDIFEQLFNAKYVNDATQLERIAFERMSQIPGETARTYLGRLASAALRLGLDDNTVLKRMRTGLTPQYIRFCESALPANDAEARATALRFDTISQLGGERYPEPTAFTNAMTQINHIPYNDGLQGLMPIGQAFAPNSQPIGLSQVLPPELMTEQQKRDPGVQTLVELIQKQKLSNEIENLFGRDRGNETRNYQSRDYGENKRNIICRNCQRIGHFEAECRSTNRWNNQQSNNFAPRYGYNNNYNRQRPPFQRNQWNTGNNGQNFRGNYGQQFHRGYNGQGYNGQNQRWNQPPWAQRQYQGPPNNQQRNPQGQQGQYRPQGPGQQNNGDKRAFVHYLVPENVEYEDMYLNGRCR